MFIACLLSEQCRASTVSSLKELNREGSQEPMAKRLGSGMFVLGKIYCAGVSRGNVGEPIHWSWVLVWPQDWVLETWLDFTAGPQSGDILQMHDGHRWYALAVSVKIEQPSILGFTSTQSQNWFTFKWL